jgi:hypothetical protein
MLVLDDLAKGGMENVTLRCGESTLPTLDGPVEGVHWEAYIKHYLDNVKKELEARAAAPQSAPFITPDQDQAEASNDVVFGGEDEPHGETSTGDAASP